MNFWFSRSSQIYLFLSVLFSISFAPRVLALGGDDTNTVNQINAATATCQATLQSAGAVFVKARADAIASCLSALVDCDEEADSTAAESCREGLLNPDSGACAAGQLDSGMETIGSVSLTIETNSSSAIIDQALIAFISAVNTDCFVAAGVELESTVNGLGFSTLPANQYQLVDLLNDARGGLSCTANESVRQATPLVDTMIDLLNSYDSTCVVVDGGSVIEPCSANSDCGGGGNGRCGVIAAALTNGSSSGFRSCTSGICQPGYYFIPPDGNCIPCAAGEFSSTTNATTCEDCPLGRYAIGTGNFECFPCGAGTFSDQGADECTDCAVGETSNVESSTCFDCGAGTFAAISGMASCLDCPAGTFSAMNASECTPCEPGEYSEGGVEECETCAAGYFAPIEGMSECAPCRAGSFSQSGATVCTDCLAGTFSSETASAECDPCPAGTFGQVGASGCVACPAGYASEGGASECTVCAAGSFSSAGATDCVLCEAGRYAPSVASGECLECPAGSFSESGASGCTECEPGSFSEQAGASLCSECPKGRFARQAGSTACKKCPAGKIARRTGSRRCTPCPSGTSPNRRATRCR